MRTRRESMRGKMVNYSHMLIAALSVTAVVLLIKYRNLIALMAEEEMAHGHNQKLLLDDLGRESSRNKLLNDEMNKRLDEIKTVEEKLKGVQDELSNSIGALQASNDQIEALKLEKQTQNEEIENLNEEKANLQIQITVLQDDLQKTRAMVDDSALTIKDSQNKQEALISENARLVQEVANFQALQGENENLRVQIQNALAASQNSENRVKELEAQLKQKREAEANAAVQQANENKPDEAAIPKEEPNQALPEPPKEELNQDVPEPPKEEPNQEPAETPKDTPPEAPKGKNPDYNNKEEDVENDVAAYDMLDEDEKTKLKRELQDNEAAEGGEVIDNPADKKEGDGEVLEDGEGRELDNPGAVNDAAEEQNDNAQGDGKIEYPDAEDENKKDDLPEENVEGAGEPNGAEGSDAEAPKSFEEAMEGLGSFDSPGKRGLLSYQFESSDNENEAT